MQAVHELPSPGPALRLWPRNLGAVVQDELREGFLRAAFRALGPRDRLLDLGCATRPFEPLYRPFVRRAFGLDVPTTPHGGARVDVAATGLALPFADGSFDVVLCTEVMEHVPDPARLLGEIRRVLRPGGAAILTTPFLVGEHEAPRDFFRYTRYGLRHLAEGAGLEVAEIRPFAGLCGVCLSFLVQVQMKAWEALGLARLWNPLVFALVYLPQRLYLALARLARGPRLKKLAYCPKGFGMIARAP